jgi:hypothetical protein
MLGARRGAVGGHHVPWQQLDLTDPDHPRLNCTLAQLAEMQERGGQERL